MNKYESFGVRMSAASNRGKSFGGGVMRTNHQTEFFVDKNETDLISPNNAPKRRGTEINLSDESKK